MSTADFSIIVPSFNSEEFIARCLEHILKYCDQSRCEVIVVDDASTDQSPNIIENYPVRLVKRDKNGGPAAARNTGAALATGKLLVFVDADVLIGPDTFEQISAHFADGSEVDAVTGLFSLDETTDVASATTYKNRYMNYVFRKTPKRANFLFGSIAAIRADKFIPWPEDLRFGEDAFLGQLLTSRGNTIILDHNLEIKHLKKYTWLSLFKNDFQVAKNFTDIFLCFSQWSTLNPGNQQFSHVGRFQLYSIALCGLSILSALFQLPAVVFAVLFVLWLWTNRHFLSFYSKHSNILGVVVSAIATMIDHFVMGFGITVGILRVATLRSKVKKFSVELGATHRANDDIVKARG